jgi:hypothetical protein
MMRREGKKEIKELRFNLCAKLGTEEEWEKALTRARLFIIPSPSPLRRALVRWPWHPPPTETFNSNSSAHSSCLKRKAERQENEIISVLPFTRRLYFVVVVVFDMWE